MGDNYILEGREPIEEGNLLEWAKWIANANRRVNISRIQFSVYNQKGKKKIGFHTVSTVFLGLDHSFFDGPPLLFETIVFGGKLDLEMTRCSTWEEAEKMHEEMCNKVMPNLHIKSTFSTA